MRDIRDFYITWDGHPRFQEGEIIQSDPINVIVQKIELILFTNKGEFIGDLNLGADLTYFLWTTTVSPDFIKGIIQQQFNQYVPELQNYNLTLNVYLMEGTLQDILIVEITIDGVGIKAVFS